ncbi:MAG TPA: MFS transporter [Micromonosporaceae bacterium]|nr:MFS transporter [Micromonosporaceae bacterium]
MRRLPALLVVCLAVFVDMLGFGIILPLLPFHIASLGGSGVWLGAIMTAYAAAQFLAAPVLGALSDRYGRRRLLVLSLAGSAVSMALTGLAGSLPLLLAARLVAGGCGGSIAVAQAYVVELVEPRNRLRALGAVGASIGFGFVVGPAIGAGLAGLGTGFAGACFVAAGIAVVNIGLALALLPRRAVATTGGSVAAPASRPGRFGGITAALRNPSIRPVLLAIFITMAAFAGMETTFAYLGAARFNLTAAGLGIVFTGVGIVLIVVQGGLVGRAADRFGDRRVAVGGAVLLAAGLVVLPFAPAFVAYPALGVVAVGQGLLTTTTAALIAKATAEGGAELGGAMGVGQSAASAARALGPLAAGAAYDVAMPMPYLASAVLCGVAVMLLARGRSRHASSAVAGEHGVPAEP